MKGLCKIWQHKNRLKGGRWRGWEEGSKGFRKGKKDKKAGLHAIALIRIPVILSKVTLEDRNQCRGGWNLWLAVCLSSPGETQWYSAVKLSENGVGGGLGTWTSNATKTVDPRTQKPLFMLWTLQIWLGPDVPSWVEVVGAEWALSAFLPLPDNYRQWQAAAQ